MELKTPVIADGPPLERAKLTPICQKKKRLIMTRHFLFHFLSFAVLASIPKRLSHNLLNWPYFCPGTLKE
jgi:hypothetical protein